MSIVLRRTTLNVTSNSPSQDYTHPDDHNLSTYDMNPGFKAFTTLGRLQKSKQLFEKYLHYTGNSRFEHLEPRIQETGFWRIS